MFISRKGAKAQRKCQSNPFSNKRVICCACLFFILFVFQPILLGIPEPGSQTISLKDGRQVQGFVGGLNASFLHLHDARAPLQIEHQIPRDQIVRIQFVAFEAGLGLSDLKGLYQQRALYFDKMEDADILPFEELVELAYQEGDFFLAAGVAEKLLEYLEDRVSTRRIQEIQLLSLMQLPLNPKTIEIAQQWIAEGALSESSVLGCYALAQIAYRSGDYEEALTIALEPIAYATFLKPKYLKHCYDVAILAAEQIGDDDLVVSLSQERLVLVK